MECMNLNELSSIARDHATNPRNQGPLKKFDGHARITGPCGDTMEFWLTNGRAASSRKRSFDPQSARYDFRVFLLHLGLIGDEFKTARKHLIAAPPGDTAFKRSRVKPNEQSAPKAEPLTEAGPETRPPAFSGDETGGMQGGAS